MFCGTSHTLQSKQMQGYVGTKRLAQRLLQAYHRHLSCIPDIPQPPVYKEYVLPLQVLYAVLRGHRYSQWLSFLHCSTGSDVLPPLMESRFHEPEGWHKVLYAQPWVFFVAYGFYFYRFCWFCSCILLFLFLIWNFCFFTSNAKELSLSISLI